MQFYSPGLGGVARPVTFTTETGDTKVRQRRAPSAETKMRLFRCADPLGAKLNCAYRNWRTN